MSLCLELPRKFGKTFLNDLLNEARKEERKGRALAVSIRLEALAGFVE